MPPLSFYPRKYALFTVSADDAQPLVFCAGDKADAFSLHKAVPETGAAFATAVPGQLLTLLFGPLWVSAYVDDKLTHRAWRRDGKAPYGLSHPDGMALAAHTFTDALADKAAFLDPLDRGQLLLLAPMPEQALRLARTLGDMPDDAPYRTRLAQKALRQAFAAHREAALSHAARGERAKALATIEEALALYAGEDEMVPAWTTPEANRKVIILADLSLPQCRHYRIEQKTEQLAMLGTDYAVFDQADADAFIAATADATLALFYRVPYVPRVAEAVHACHVAGLPCLYETDDLLFDAAAFPGARDTYGDDFTDAEYSELLILPPLYRAAMTACDGAIASTDALAAEMRAHMGTKPVYMHPNGLGGPHLRAMNAAPDRTGGDTVTLFYGSGTRALQQDFDLLADHVLAPLMARQPHLRLALAGHCDMPDSLMPYAEHITRLAPQSQESYWQALAGADINLAPLTPSRFNDCKSAIKWLEAAMFRIPSVVSATETYKAVLTDGENACLAPDWSDWTAALEQLTGDAAMRRRIGEAAYAFALERFGPDGLSRNIDAIVRNAESRGG
ncbi:glycosyltransferase family protein [Kordiimonas marina]|uniref:glycosyltransferase family protein n=1 Tax=Kordiimonas marina TaxID=2872312 RepID=UPI001FF66554|nr:glycosyltransferase [Kordiimonas marina]MCJ9430766.1 glycosyltransferase [Kordiimonas marina]